MALHSITRGFISLALAAGVAGLTNPASATVLKVDIDTSSLTGTAQLAFDLTDGDGVANNTVTIEPLIMIRTLLIVKLFFCFYK